MLHDEHLVGAAVELHPRREDQRRVGAAQGGRRHPRRVRSRSRTSTCASGAATSSSCSSACCATCSAATPARSQPPPDAIVVAYDLSPADTAQLHKAAVSGLITDAGGKTSHTAIIARAHEIPAVVGLENITELVETDDLAADRRRRGHRDRQPVGGDGRRSTARSSGARSRRARSCRRCAICRRARSTTSTSSSTPTSTAPTSSTTRSSYGAMGVGLFRTEYLFMGHAELPDEERHYQTAVEVIERLGGLPATIRTFDLGADKLAPFLEAGRSRGGEPRARAALDPAVPRRARPRPVQDPAARPAARVGARPDQAHVPDDLGRRRAARREGRASTRSRPS